MYPGLTAERFDAISDRVMYCDEATHTDTPCWEWPHAHNDRGYGQTRVGRKVAYVHRVMYAVYVEELQPGITVDHTCENKKCCNPEHLQAVTRPENSALRHTRRRKRGSRF